MPRPHPRERGRAVSAAPLHIKPRAGRLRLVQVTDTHLGADPGAKLLGVDTDSSLQYVLDLVVKERVQGQAVPDQAVQDKARAERGAIDLVLGTGDIAISHQDGAGAYPRAREYFAQLGAPVLWLPGNHDNAAAMAAVLGNDGQLARAAQSPHWLILMLNSQVPGEVGGHLGADELDWLGQSLDDAGARGLHVLVCLHHQPVPVGSAWLDQQMVKNRDALFKIIGGASTVRGVLWGHVHQQLDGWWSAENGALWGDTHQQPAAQPETQPKMQPETQPKVQRGAVRLMATPSTCVQFTRHSDAFKADNPSRPGYRWLDLLDDGGIETGVSRVAGVGFTLDSDSSGYQ